VVFAFLPWLPAMADLAGKQGAGGARPLGESLALLRVVFMDFAGRNTILAIAFVVLALVGLWRLRKTWVLLYSVLLFALPVVALFTFQTKHFVSSRYFAFLLPQYMILVGCGIAGIAETAARLTARGLSPAERRTAIRAGTMIVLIAAVFAGSLPMLHLYYGSGIQNWREAADIILREAKPGDRIFCGVNMSGEALRYYIGRHTNIRRFSYVEQCRNPQCFQAAFAGLSRGWVVTSHGEFTQERYPELWNAIGQRMDLYARLPAMEEWGEIWIFRMKGQEGGAAG